MSLFGKYITYMGYILILQILCHALRPEGGHLFILKRQMLVHKYFLKSTFFPFFLCQCCLAGKCLETGLKIDRTNKVIKFCRRRPCWFFVWKWVKVWASRSGSKRLRSLCRKTFLRRDIYIMSGRTTNFTNSSHLQLTPENRYLHGSHQNIAHSPLF